MMKETRVVSQEEEFMKEKRINDRVLSYILSNATQEWEELWIRKSDCSAPLIAKTLNINDNNEKITEYTVRNCIKSLIAIGVLSQSTKKINSRARPIYIVKQNNYKFYTIVDMSIIRLSLSLGSTNLLKIYSFLKCRYESYKRGGKEFLLEVSIEKLAEAIGYSSYVETRAMVKDILDVLCRCDLISLKKETRKAHSNTYEVYVLTNVATRYERGL